MSRAALNPIQRPGQGDTSCYPRLLQTPSLDTPGDGAAAASLGTLSLVLLALGWPAVAEQPLPCARPGEQRRSSPGAAHAAPINLGSSLALS